jgi:hypothetical protein
MIDKGDKLPVTRQCDLLELNRSFVYYTPAPLSAKEMELNLLVESPSRGHFLSPIQAALIRKNYLG